MSAMLWKAAHFLVWGVLFAVFSFEVYISFEKYFQRRLSTVRWVEDNLQEQQLPTVTLCPVLAAEDYEEIQSRNLTKWYWDVLPPLERVILRLEQTFHSDENDTLLVMGNGMERIKGVEDYLFPAIDATAALLMRCLSYTPPKRSKAGITNALVLVLNTTRLRYVYLALHQDGQFFPSGVDFLGGHIAYVDPQPHGITRINSTHVLAPKAYYSVDKTVRITYKNDSNCLSESDMGARTLNNCFEKHVNDDLKCVFPWHLDLEDHRREGKKVCDEESDFARFLDISRKLFHAGDRGVQDITKCVPTCMVRHYEVHTKSDFDKTAIPLREEAKDVDSVVVLSYYYPKTEVIFTEEVLRYDFSNVIADVGGYLGLLLGGSILSIYNYLTREVRMKWKKK